MNCSRNAILPAALLAWAAAVSGCTPPAAPGPGARGEGVAIDPCADRLHDVCGQLLIYYAAHNDLPGRLADLDKGGARPSPSATCPVSGKAYVYDRKGLQVPGRPGRLIVYDAEPCHSGMRWGILMETQRPGSPLVLRVIRA